jgi:hypothetical protein
VPTQRRAGLPSSSLQGTMSFTGGLQPVSSNQGEQVRSARGSIIYLKYPLQRQFYVEMAWLELARSCRECSTSARHLPKAGGDDHARDGGGHPQRAGEVPPGAGHGLFFHRPAEAHDRGKRTSTRISSSGRILCGDKNREQIELVQLDWGEIRVEAKLHEAKRLARGRVEREAGKH